MKASRVVVALAVLALAPAARAWQQCPQKTIGDVFLDFLEARLNDGLRPEEYWNPVPGMQLHLDSSSAPPPSGSFFKPPAAWPAPGADAQNRIPLGAMVFPLTDKPQYMLNLRLHDINLKNFGIEYDCDPNSWGGALADGGLSQDWLMSPAGDPNISLRMGFHLKFRVCEEVCVPLTDWCHTVCLISVDEWVTSDFVEADLSRDFTIATSIVPKVSADGDSIDVQGFVDAHEAVNQIVMDELYDDAAVIAAIAGVAICAPWALFSVVCEGVVVVTALAVLWAYEDELRAFAESNIESAFSGLVNDVANRPPAGSPPGTAGNQLIRTAIDRFRQKVRSLQIPERLATLPVPDFDDVVPFDPPYAPACP